MLTVLALGLITGAVFFAPAAHAFTPNYNPNNLIDNPTFLNNGSMSASDIQAFLQNVGSGLANYSDVEACSGNMSSIYPRCGQTVSAAQLIYDAAQAYGLSPRTILATLEKEQILVTDPTPSSSQLNCAMGYNSCSGYVGFFTQVDWGSWALRYNYEGAMQHTSWMGEYPAANYPCSSAHSGFYSNGLYPGNTVTFADSGGTAETITIANAATASLYCYTPYVGPYSVTGYSGSYNFVYFFQLWFGATQASVPYAWAYEGQSAYQDSTHDTPLTGTPTVAPGGTIYVQVLARNVGYQSWDQSSLHIGTSNPDDRSSVFYDSNWLNQARPVGPSSSTVAPGDEGVFNFALHAPTTTGTYDEYFNLVEDGVTWLNDPGLYYRINVVNPVQATNNLNTGLQSGQSLSVGKYLLSPDTHSTLNLQSDGNLVLYSDYNHTWANYTFDSQVSKLVMQGDGNLVEYDASGKSVWASNTYNNPGAYLSLQVDGNLVIYSSSGSPLWTTSTVAVPNYLDRIVDSIDPGVLFVNQSLQTPDRTYQLTLQSDGNLVLYHNGTAIWATMTAGKLAGLLAMQPDGNLVLYSESNQVLWSSNTNGQGESTLCMQPDGNVVVYNSTNKPTWASNTNNGTNRL
ncbi:MAG TPA: hypothetical protein VFN56_01890 [Candidatus Saccharimonadales bacterium]|nr:hypothetical protein [Candidatus Saccharimonadales bacterium]